MAEKARYWCGVLYPENMRPDWQEVIGDILGYPYAYCIHDKDSLAAYELKEDDEHMRKTHVHLIVVYGNTTTYNSVLKLMQKLNASDRNCINKVEAISNIRNMYEYLIHNTETCRKQQKYQYSPEERITGNNFDIGSFEQLSTTDKRTMLKELCDMVKDNGICNFMDLYELVAIQDDSAYFEILASYASFLEKLTKANYQKWAVKQ